METTKRTDYRTSYTIDSDDVQVTKCEVYVVDGKEFLGDVQTYALKQSDLGLLWGDNEIISACDAVDVSVEKAKAASAMESGAVDA